MLLWKEGKALDCSRGFDTLALVLFSLRRRPAAIASISGLLIAAAMPRGPVTVAQAFSLLLIDALVGLASRTV